MSEFLLLLEGLSLEDKPPYQPNSVTGPTRIQPSNLPKIIETRSFPPKKSLVVRIKIKPRNLQKILNIRMARSQLGCINNLRNVFTTRFPWHHSPLDKLPLQLRRRIWELVLTNPYPLTVTFDPCAQVPLSIEGSGCPLAGTCRKIRQECLPLFYQQNIFVLPFNNISHDLERFFLQHAPDRQQYFRAMANFQSENWEHQRKPLSIFISLMEKLKVSNLRVRIDIGTFDMDMQTARENLLFTLLRLNTFLSPYGNLFGGECKILFSIITREWKAPRKQRKGIIDCKALCQSYHQIRQFYDTHELERVVDSMKMKMVAGVFKILEEREV